MRKLKKIIATVLAVTMMMASAFCGTTTVQAEEKTNNLSDGNYQTVLNITDWQEKTEVTQGLRVSSRASISKTSNMNLLQIQVTGYSQYSAIYMAKQDADIEEIDISKGGKIGEWTDISNYSKLKEGGYVDSSLNDSFVKLTPTEIDEKSDTAVFTLSDLFGYTFDCTKKVGLVGCLKREMATLKAQCNSITIKANPDMTKTTNLALMINNNITDLDLNMDINTWKYGSNSIVTGAATWNATAIEPNATDNLNDSVTTGVTYTIKNGKIIAKYFWQIIIKQPTRRFMNWLRGMQQRLQMIKHARLIWRVMEV